MASCRPPFVTRCRRPVRRSTPLRYAPHIASQLTTVNSASTTSRQVGKLVQRYPASVQALIVASRETLTSAFPDSAESVDMKAGLLGYSYGPGYAGVVATLILSKSGVKIGLPHSATFKDPAGLLAGAGKVHKHIAITTTAQLRAPAVRALLRQALDAWRARSVAHN